MTDGLEPFDLEPPRRLLYPKYTTMGERAQITKLELGVGEDRSRLERVRYPDGTVRWELLVPCDAVPHCDECECSRDHSVYISPDQVQQLKQFLGP
jgi:hypothetical protein